MKTFERVIEALTFRTAQAAQVALAFAMSIIVVNIFVRNWWKPVPGTVELVEISGAVMLSMAVAYTAVKKGHIMVSVLVERFPLRIQGIVDGVVSIIALIFSFMLARGTFMFAARMLQRGYSTGHLLIPIAPFIYLVGFGFAMLALVLLCDLIKAVILIIKGSENL